MNDIKSATNTELSQWADKCRSFLIETRQKQQHNKTEKLEQLLNEIKQEQQSRGVEE